MTERCIATPTLVHLLRQRAEQQPEERAYLFLQDDGSAASLTYGELDARARALATLLQKRFQPGERALLLYRPGLEYIAALFGCFYAGLVAVPAYPPRKNRSIQRIRAMLDNAQAKVALASPGVINSAQRTMLLEEKTNDSPLFWLETRDISLEEGQTWQQPVLTPSTLALLQYTSGSTGTPKGVMIQHEQIFFNLQTIDKAFALKEDSRGVIWLPPYHDMGLIGGILGPLYKGFPCILMSPTTFLQHPLFWLQTISSCEGQVISGGPNFAYDLCIQKISPEQVRGLRLDHWKIAFNGAEPVKSSTLERFFAHFAPAGFRYEAFYPCYGGAEATLMVSGGSPFAPPITRRFWRNALKDHLVQPVPAEVSNEENSVTLTGCGRSFPQQQIVLVDPRTGKVCQHGSVGEIWVEGPGIAAGYWMRPQEADEKTFLTRTVDGRSQRVWRTGDLGFFFDDELFVTGRLKDMLIVRGHNYYPQDIEQFSIESHPALQGSACAAFSVPSHDEGESIVVVQEMSRQSRHMQLREIFDAIRANIANHLELSVDTVVLLKPYSLPRTSSGKVSRQTCRSDFLAGTLQEIERDSFLSQTAPDQQLGECVGKISQDAPAGHQLEDLEAALKPILARILSVPPEVLQAQSSLLALGLDSLKAVDLHSLLERDWNVQISLEVLLSSTTLRELAEQLQLRLDNEHPETNQLPAPSSLQTNELYPLSYGQQALWFLYQLSAQRQHTAYHIVVALRLRSEVHLPVLRQTFYQLVERHPMLRATLVQTEAELWQKIREPDHQFFTQIDTADWNEERLQAYLEETAALPFDGGRTPLFRVYLLLRKDQRHVLLLLCHHSIVDFWSLEVLKQDFVALYEATMTQSSPPPVSTEHYIDYVRWQENFVKSPAGERQWAYWKNYLTDFSETLSLPVEKASSPQEANRRAVETLTFSPTRTRQLLALGHAHQATLFAVLLSVFQALLYRYTQQERFTIGTIVAGRGHARFASTVGYFVNLVGLRADFTGSPTFLELLARVREASLSALEYQDLPFVLLTEQLQPARTSQDSPGLQVVFTFQKEHLQQGGTILPAALDLPGSVFTIGPLTVETLDIHARHTQFDLVLHAALFHDTLTMMLEYNGALFAAQTIQRLLAHFEHIGEEVVRNPHQRISALPLLLEHEYRRQIMTWNPKKAEDCARLPVYRMFEQQASRTPQATAFVHGQRKLTYRELDRETNRLARHLRTLGVGPEVIVGVCLERSLELVIALLAVLKAGGAYLPLEPAYPQEQFAFLLCDSQAPVLISQSHLQQRLPVYTGRVVHLDTGWQQQLNLTDSSTLDGSFGLDHLAYLIYTSGSTGRPKGVAIAHSSLTNYLHWALERYSPQELRCVPAYTSVCFDPSIIELFLPLCCGGSIIMVDDLTGLSEALTAGVTFLVTIPSVLGEFLKHHSLPTTLKTLCLGGEAFTSSLRDRLMQESVAESIDNLYGPTEATINITVSRVSQEQGKPTIGRPTTNNEAYVLDANLQPTPIGVVGELYLGGAGIARGYHGRPALTAERFLPHPFSASPGQRLYRTGDLARFLPDGRIDFHGRVDRQVKVHGLRIEPGEIESAICQFPSVQECVVTVYENQHHVQQLLAYIVPRAQERFDRDQLRSFLRTKLMGSWIPTSFILLDALPLTTNGKLDRTRLPLPVYEEQSYEPAETPAEQAIMDLWSELLEMKAISRHADFFELGGHSLLAMRAISALRQQFQVDLSLQDFFLQPTPAALAAHILRLHKIQLEQPLQAQQRASQQEKREREIEELVASLSEDELDNLLRQTLSEVSDI